MASSSSSKPSTRRTKKLVNRSQPVPLNTSTMTTSDETMTTTDDVSAPLFLSNSFVCPSDPLGYVPIPVPIPVPMRRPLPFDYSKSWKKLPRIDRAQGEQQLLQSSQPSLIELNDHSFSPTKSFRSAIDQQATDPKDIPPCADVMLHVWKALSRFTNRMIHSVPDIGALTQDSTVITVLIERFTEALNTFSSNNTIVPSVDNAHLQLVLDCLLVDVMQENINQQLQNCSASQPLQVHSISPNMIDGNGSSLAAVSMICTPLLPLTSSASSLPSLSCPRYSDGNHQINIHNTSTNCSHHLPIDAISIRHSDTNNNSVADNLIDWSEFFTLFDDEEN